MTAQPKFKWGISTLGCHELNLEETCKLADRHDIHAIEIRALVDRQDLPAYLDETYTNPTDITDLLTKHHQQITALNSGFKLIGSEAADRAELCEFVRWAEMLNIPYIRIFGGGKMDTPLSVQDMDEASKNLKWWNDLRSERGWNTQIALETHSGFSSSNRCLQLQAHSGIPLDIIWDTHHTWKYGGERAQETWDKMAEMIRHVHIKDSISVPSARHPYSYVIPGTGEFPAKEVLALLTENDYENIVSLEWERKWHPYMPPLDEALSALVSNHWKSAP